MPRRLRTAAVSLALLSVLAACGGGSSSTSPTTTTSKGTGAANSSTSGSTGSSTGSSTSGSSDASVTVNTSFTGNGSAAICSYASGIQSADLFKKTASATDLKASLTQVQDILNNIKDKAPSEIKADIATMFAGYQKLIALYQKYNFDTAKLIDAASKDPNIAAEFTALGSADLTAASQRVTAYFTQVCGITTPTT